MLNAIRCLHEGGSYVPAQIVSRLAERESNASLTPREMEVLQLMSKGLSNREIGDVLGFSENTAKAHVKHIFVKVDACDRTEAIRIAVERGILHLD